MTTPEREDALVRLAHVYAVGGPPAGDTFSLRRDAAVLAKGVLALKQERDAARGLRDSFGAEADSYRAQVAQLQKERDEAKEWAADENRMRHLIEVSAAELLRERQAAEALREQLRIAREELEEINIMAGDC